MIGLGGLNQTVDDSAGPSAMDGVNDVPVGAADTEWTYSSFTGGVVDRYGTVLQEHIQILLLVYAVLQTLLGIFGNDRIRVNRFYPREISLHQRL